MTRSEYGDGIRYVECNPSWIDGINCTDYFRQMEFWEFEDLERFGSAH